MNDDKWVDNGIEKKRQEGINYFNANDYLNKWPLFQRFYEGDQWPKVTPRTKNLPRPVFNIVKYIVNHKVSSVVNENVKMVFTSQEIEEEGVDPKIDLAVEGADKFSKYSETVWENIQQDMLNEEMLQSAAIIGTGAFHYYWDNDIKGGVSNPWVGDIQGEFIDPINLFFGNPQQMRVQKQPYILITSRDLLDNIKELAKKNNVPIEYITRLQGDRETQNDYDSAKNEVQGTDKATVITQYIRKNDGFVYFKKVCNNIVIQPETSTDMRLYPIVTMSWDIKKKSIHGISDVDSLIPNQNGINFLLAMMLLSSQNVGWPKLLVKEGALKQQITNAPGEIIKDYSLQGDGIKYMNTASFDPMTLTLVDKFIDITKTFAGATDTATGQLDNKNMAASAIMLLQKASGVPIESIKKRFYRAMEDVGRVWEEFWKAKYNIPRKVIVKDENGNESMTKLKGTSYKDINFNLKIDIGPAGAYSESLAQSTLDNLFNGGHIDLQTYLKYSPKSAMPYKDSLLKEIEQKQQEEDVSLAKQILSLLPPELADMVLQQLQGNASPQGEQPTGQMNEPNQESVINPSMNRIASGQI